MDDRYSRLLQRLLPHRINTDTGTVDFNKPLSIERSDTMRRPSRTRRCPRCGSMDVLLQDTNDSGVSLYICTDCDHDFEVGGSRPRGGSRRYDQDDKFDDISSEHEWDR